MKSLIALIIALVTAQGCTSTSEKASLSNSADTQTISNPENLAELIARGKQQFIHCNTCHVVDTAQPPPSGVILGPHLESIVGRPAASVAGFPYSAELQALNLVWDEATLDEWLRAPQTMVPGMCMPFMGLSKSEARKALIAYLAEPTT